MIGLYIVFFVVGLVTLAVAAKLNLPLRLAVAVAVFVVPSILVTLWVLKTGDKAPPDAITVLPDTKIEKPKEDKKE